MSSENLTRSEHLIQYVKTNCKLPLGEPILSEDKTFITYSTIRGKIFITVKDDRYWVKPECYNANSESYHESWTLHDIEGAWDSLEDWHRENETWNSSMV
jgi:hypothetical protein